MLLSPRQGCTAIHNLQRVARLLGSKRHDVCCIAQVWYNDVRAALLAEWEEGRSEQISSWAAEREQLQLQLESYRSAANESDVLIGKYEQYLDRSVTQSLTPPLKHLLCTTVDNSQHA